MNTIPATIDLNPLGGHPEASVIWMHGLGADGNDFVPIVERFKSLQSKVRFVFPHAPMRSVTVNGGVLMRAWYDIAALEISRNEDVDGIKESARLIDLLIKREQELGVESSRIVLAGFSQGGAMALHAGLRYSEPLAGIIALSSYLPLPNTLIKERDLANQNTPIFMTHGLFDTIVPIMLDQMSKEQLQALGYKIDWFTYPMAHAVVPEEIDDIYHFLERVLLA
ncbi:MAG TPA: dienelactone hydrolase family protein [Gammaproteobacteria bacterium]|nr:dienelactone hydrolase family protein [Gammaproteobacteria bacterium]